MPKPASPAPQSQSDSLLRDLRVTLGRLESALASVSEGLCITDSQLKVLWCNGPLERLLSANRLELLGKSLVDLVRRIPTEDRRIDIRKAVSDDPEGGHRQLLIQQDPIQAMEIEWRQIPNENPPCLIFTFRDISDQVTLQELRQGAIELISEETRFAVASALCPTTGLPTRHGFLRQLSQKLEERAGDGMVLLLFNLTALRLTNDRFGYQTGDELLAEVARRLKQAARTGDLVARFGGDQFVVLCTQVSGSDEPMLIAERLQRRIAEPFVPATIPQVIEMQPQTTVGVAMTRAGSTADSLIRGAEAALSRALSKTSVMSEPEALLEGAQIERSLAVGVALERYLHRQLVPIALQPMVSMPDQETYGFEALARPQLPDGTAIPVQDFVSLAEHLGVMGSLGEILLRSSFDTYQKLKLKDSGLRLSVNISPSQLSQSGFSEVLLTLAKQFDIPLSLLTLEITETALIKDEVALRQELNRLRESGVRVLLDDFGTGFSSLNWIFSVPTDGIKIDKSYTAAFMNDPARSMIMSSIQTICADLGFEAVVEGVESTAQRDALLDLGFSLGQGYLFGKPAAAESIRVSGAQHS